MKHWEALGGKIFCGVTFALAMSVMTPAFSQTAAVQAAFQIADGGTGIPTGINYGGTAQFSLRVSNPGPSNANSTVLSGSVSAPATISAVSAGCSRVSSNTGYTCNLGVLDDGAQTVATVTITVPAQTPPYPAACPAGTLIGPLTAGVTWTNPNGSTGSVTVPGVSIPTRPFADLAVSQTGPDSAKEGDTVQYQVTARNLGSCPATNVKIYNDNSSNTLDQQTVTGACSDFPCTIPVFEPGGIRTFTATYKVTPLPLSIIDSGNPHQIDILSELPDPPRNRPHRPAAVLDPNLRNNSTIIQTNVHVDRGGCNSTTSGRDNLFLIGLVLAALVGGRSLRRRQSQTWIRSTVLTLTFLMMAQLGVSTVASAQETSGPAPTTSPETTAAPPDTSTDATPSTRGKRSAQEEIVVTGSRVRRKDLTTPAPITVINREQITASGKVSIGDFLQALPTQGNAINTTINNGGEGATRINLRGLGAQETLVLVNGRRYVPGGLGANSSVDLNSIPTAAIERIEVLKDGASAIYGSDAIGGVVNLITRKRFSGAEVSGYVGTTSHGDGTVYDLNGSVGVSGDKGGALLTVGYFNQFSVFANKRSFSNPQIFYDATGQNNLSGRLGQYFNGSGTIPQGRVVIPGSQVGVPNGNDLWNSLVTNNPGSNSFIRDPNAPGGWRPWRGSSLPPDGDGYNFQPENYLVTPQQRISMFSTGEHRLNDSVRAYYEAAFVNRQSDQRLAPEPLVTDTENITISAGGIYNPFGRDFSGVRRRLLEFGPRQFFQDLDTFRAVVGVDGTLPEGAGFFKGWFWDVSFNYGRTFGTENKRGNLFRPNLQSAVGPSFRDATGTPRCGTPSAIIAGCVPLNLFGGPGTITEDQIANLTFTGVRKALNQMLEGQVNVSGELFKLLADRPVGIALGYAYRNLSGASIYDPVTVLGLTTGNKSTNTQGRYYLNEGYGELSIPVVSGLPGVDSVELTAAARVFNYSNFGSDFTYKFGALWRVVPDLTLRGTAQTGFRAPSIGELFLGQQDNFPNVRDPCRGPAAGGPAPPPNCAAQGVANNGDDQTQLRSRVGGNPNLKAEKAKIYTAGVVVQPRWLRNFSVTADYYNIRIEKTITTLGANVILAGCYPNAGGTPRYCENIERNTATNRILNIIDVNTNVGEDSTDGIDISARYAVPTDFGRFGILGDATWLHKYDRILADGTLVHGKGVFDIQQVGAGSGGVFPEWKFLAGLTYSYAGLSGGILTHFVQSFRECGDSSGDFSGSGLCYQDKTFSRKVGTYNSWDIYLAYSLASPIGRTTIGAGVNNVFDRQPPFIYNGFTANSDPTAYPDAFLGRFGYLRVSQAF